MSYEGLPAGPPPAPGADVVIVGAGSAGCVLAARLSEDPTREVVLVEAGPDHRVADLADNLRLLSKAIAWPYDWGDTVVNAQGRRLHYGRGRGVGGSSLTNGGVAMRAERPDIDRWLPGWRFDDLLPAFCRLEHDLDFPDEPYHGAHGPIPIVRWPRESWTPLQAAFHDACVALGFAQCPDHNAPDTTGVGPIPMNRVDRERRSALHTHLETARSRTNLVVRGDAHVSRIVVDNGRVSGVELADGERISAGEVVVCAGVLQDPLLLWRSGIGPAAELGALGVDVVADLAAVGRHVSDHFVMTFANRIDPAAVVEGAPSLQTILRATSGPGGELHDLQLTPFVRNHDDGTKSIAISVSLQLPVGEGEVRPGGGGVEDPPHVSWPFTAHPHNVARLREGWRLAARIVEASGLSVDPDGLRRELEADDHLIDAKIAADHTAFYHGVGSCRMGADPADSVVDDRLEVHGVEGLRIVDASVIPTVPRSNTNLVVMALAEHAAATCW